MWVAWFSEENYKRLLDVFSIECLVHLEQYIILTILLSWLMILFKLMRKRNMNTDVCQNFTHSVFHDVNHFFAESDNSFKYWKNIFSSFFVLFLLGWCKSNCSFALLNFAIWYWNTFLNKCGYVIHHFNVHFSLYVFW